MKSLKIEAILEELGYQKGIRGKSDPLRWDAYSIVKHRTERFSTTDSPIKHEHLYDDTGVQAFETFISGFMDSFTPPTQDWFTPKLESTDYNRTLTPDFGGKYLSYIKRAMKHEIDHSNFYDQEELASKDTICGGYSCKLIQNNEEDGVIFSKTLEPWRCWFDRDLKGNWDLFLYEYNLTGRELLEKFPDLDKDTKIYESAKKGPRRTFPILYCIAKRDRIVDNNGDKVKFSPIIRKNMKYAVMEISVSTSEMLQESGSTFFPVVIHTLLDTGDNQYGCGLIMKYIEEFSKLNRVGYEFGLAVAKLNHAPFFVPAEMMDDFSNDPEARIPIQSGSLTATRVEDPVDLSAALAVLEDQRSTVKNLLYNSLFSFLTDSDKVYTATQINALNSESYSKLTPLYGTVTNKKLDPTLKIILKIMIDEKRVTLDPNYLGKNASTRLKFTFDSAMAQAMEAYTRSNAVNVTLETLSVFMNMGFTEVADNVNRDNMLRDVMYSGGAPSTYFIDSEQVKAIREQRAEMMAQQAQIQNELTQSEINRNNAGAANLNNNAGFNGGAE